MKTGKVVIVGSGMVGSTAAYAIMIDGAAKEIALVDVCKELAQGHAMDLSHGAEFAPTVKVNSCDDYSVCKDAEIIVICAGIGRKPGQSRLDLIKTNAGILKDVISKIVSVNKDCILLVVANPVDVLTYLSIKYSGFNANKVFGTGTMLDTARFKFLLSEHFNSDPTKVNAWVLGEHGASAFPYSSALKIDNKEITDKEKINEIFKQVKEVSAEVIVKKGATYYAIGLCIAKAIRAILEDKEEVMPVSTLLNDYHGIKDVCLSIPCVINREGIKQTKIELSDEEKKSLENSANILKEIISKVFLS